MTAPAAHDGRRRTAAAWEPVRLARSPTAPPAVPAAPALAPRAREVLALLATGQRTRASADQLGVSKNTIDEHSLNLRQQLPLACRNARIVDAVSHAWCTSEMRHAPPVS
jgi:DNA-binding NarL/FixJ family response regulator